MWAVKNHTPYKVGKTWSRDKEGVHEWIVAVKATFDVNGDGTLKVAEEQLEPLLLPEYRGEPGVSSLRYDADLTTAKPTTDVVLNGTAYAPLGRPSTDFPVTLRVGPIHKTLRVRGNRYRDPGLLGDSPTRPQPVTQLPLVYERAYGGYDHSDPDPKHHKMDARNPVGCGAVLRSDDPAGSALPNFEYPDGSGEQTGPAGFGAIDSAWSPRRELAGTYDAAWQRDRLPLLPLDWDPRCLLCSPADQRPNGYLYGGERVELLNLTPGGRLGFTLPKIYFAFTTRVNAHTMEHRGRLSTVIIEPDHPRVIMVWLSALKCPVDADYLDRTIVREKPYVQ